MGGAFGDILLRAQAGDETAFAHIFRDLQPALLRYLRVIAPDPEDMAGETWAQVVAGLAGFRGDEQAFPRAWLFTIARHRAADGGRSRARRPTVPLELSEAAEQLVSPDTADLALEAVTVRTVLMLIASLPHDQAEVIMLRVVARPGARRCGADRGQDSRCGAGGRASRPPAARRTFCAGGCNTMRGPDAMHGEMPGFFPAGPAVSATSRCWT